MLLTMAILSDRSINPAECRHLRISCPGVAGVGVSVVFRSKYGVVCHAFQEGNDMPETKFTKYANHVYQLVVDVRDFSQRAVHPAIEAMPLDKDRNPRREIPVSFTFLRILHWLHTCERLNQTSDWQAVGAGARAVFEHYLDLIWLKSYPDDRWIECWWRYQDVNAYQIATRALNRRASGPGSAIDAGVYQAAVDRMNAAEPVELIVSRCWGVCDGKPKWPGFHWTGIGNLRQRAERLGDEHHDEYVELYPILSNLVHPGPMMLGMPFEQIELRIAHAYLHMFRRARDAVIVTCDLLRFRERISEYDKFMSDLAKWTDDAIAAFPK